MQCLCKQMDLGSYKNEILRKNISCFPLPKYVKTIFLLYKKVKHCNLICIFLPQISIYVILC